MKCIFSVYETINRILSNTLVHETSNQSTLSHYIHSANGVFRRPRFHDAAHEVPVDALHVRPRQPCYKR